MGTNQNSSSLFAQAYLDSIMDRGLCSAVFVDERAAHERWISRENLDTSENGSNASASSAPLDNCPELASSVEHILGICKQGQLRPTLCTMPLSVQAVVVVS